MMDPRDLLTAAVGLIVTTLAVALFPTLPGCALPEREVYVQEPVPVPPRPDVPTVAAGELECLSDDAYRALAERDAVLEAHIARLERLIRTTHEDVD
ncbi:hypothetical protein [Halorhodospira sp. 9622]|uniref:hypothetical protein n=1 Tax=Halorhodospira sp. 9622 TaxID=2899136 RepID=UPI001EE7E87F|nr:hypothetical protein [Halorhodospira sp. 9622]MCG5538960.1 hypothetical protein [Halorhodospira sp. 9622]